MLTTNQTTATVGSLNEAAGQQTQRRGNRIPPYPGAEERHYKTFWLGTQDKHNEVEVIFVSNPIQVLCFRTAVEAMTKNGRTWPIEALHLAIRYALKTVDGLQIKKVKEGVTDLYADCFGDVAEKWTIIPILCRTPQYDERGNRLKFVGGTKNGKPLYREDYRFIELAPGSDALRIIAEKMEHPFFAKSGQGLVGSHWTIHKKGKNPPREGHWDLKTKKTETGTEYMQHNEKKLFSYIISQANKDVPKDAYEKGERKMYVSSFDEAYPVANVDQQRMVLQLHAELMSEHPDFEKRFPAMLKRLNNDGELVGVTLGDEVVTDLDDEGETTDGQVASIDELDDGDSVDFDDAEGGGETETGDTETIDETEEAAEEAGDVEVFYTNDVDETGGYELKDGTPCDEDGNPLTEDEEDEAAEDEEDEEDTSGTTSEDPQQDAGIADEEGDTSAFDMEEEKAAEEVKKAATKKKAVADPEKKKVAKAEPEKKAEPAKKPVKRKKVVKK